MIDILIIKYVFFVCVCVVCTSVFMYIPIYKTKRPTLGTFLYCSLQYYFVTGTLTRPETHWFIEIGWLQVLILAYSCLPMEPSCHSLIKFQMKTFTYDSVTYIIIQVVWMSPLRTLRHMALLNGHLLYWASFISLSLLSSDSSQLKLDQEYRNCLWSLLSD